MHSGCLFHFIRSVHRKIISLGIGDNYSKNADIREQCKELMALSLMPLSEVEHQFHRLRQVSSPSLDDLFQYFDRQWIKGNVALSMWNFHELNHRTNNISEGNGTSTPCLFKPLLDSLCFMNSLQPALWISTGQTAPQCMDIHTANAERKCSLRTSDHSTECRCDTTERIRPNNCISKTIWNAQIEIRQRSNQRQASTARPWATTRWPKELKTRTHVHTHSFRLCDLCEFFLMF